MAYDAFNQSFQYTDYLDPVFKSGSRETSDAINSLWYDSDTRELIVVIAASGNAYLYKDVPNYVWNAFSRSVSKGYFYSKAIKTEYGPSDDLGDVDYISFDAKKLVAPGTASLGTPKALTLADDAKVTTSAEVFPLTVVDGGKGKTRLHEVVFVVSGGTEERTYKTEATDVNAAVDNLAEVATMLQLVFTVRKVVTHFA